jgi:bifunctional DNA-binding transcriptional regulator/antitoxin component of YhaV-PrlF toxin-antitoxin module
MLEMKMSEGGRVVVPLEIRKSLGLKAGDTILWDYKPELGATLTTRAQRLRRAQDIVRPYLIGKPSLVDELIAERRAEAAL